MSTSLMCPRPRGTRCLIAGDARTRIGERPIRDNAYGNQLTGIHDVAIQRSQLKRHGPNSPGLEARMTDLMAYFVGYAVVGASAGLLAGP
jgi:hypothetical protein